MMTTHLTTSLSSGLATRQASPSLLPRDEDFIDLLKSSDFDTRLQTLNRAVGISKRDPEWFQRFTKKGELFKCLDRILIDDRWEVQHQCIKFLVESMPTFGTNLEYCVCYVMPNIIPKLGSPKITIRRISSQAIVTFLKLQPAALTSVLKMLSTFLLSGGDKARKLEVIHEVPTLFIEQLKEGNWSQLLDTLCTLLESSEKEIGDQLAMTLKKLEGYIGKDSFARDFNQLTSQQQKMYAKYTHSLKVVEDEHKAPPVNHSTMKLVSGEQKRFRFGIVPSHIAAMIIDESDANSRIAGLEKLKQILEKISLEEVNRLIPHLHSFLLSLAHVLADLNFKVVVIALDVVRLTVNRVKGQMEPYLHQVVSLLSKHFGNQKAVIKQLIMITCIDLFQNVNPKSVIGTLRVYLEHKNSRIREEVVNIITAALMIAPNSNVNFGALINMLVPLLCDPKRRVRLAAFEQLSVIAYMLNGKLECLMKAVKEAENESNCQGLQTAVMARIRRQMLPRIRYDGLVEYSTPPASDSSFDVDASEMTAPENADLHWILYFNQNDPMDRTMSPNSLTRGLASTLPSSGISLPSNLTNGHLPEQEPSDANHNLIGKSQENRNSTPKPGIIQKILKNLPWETDKDMSSAKCVLPELGRMKSDDVIVRQQSAESMSNPNSSTNSWHGPTRRNNSISDDNNRASSAALNRSNNRHLENGYESPENNHKRPMVKRKKSLNRNNSLSKARSEGNLSEDRGEVENQPPNHNHAVGNYDEMPIKPAKNGQYMNEYDYGLTPMTKKSSSHHSLPITNHAPLKNVHSQPHRKSNAFLKSAGSNRVKPIGKSPSAVSREHSRNHISAPLEGASVQTALKKIESEEWNDKVDGLNMLADLSASNPRQVHDHLKDVVVAILNECKNLRSSVSRVALVTIGIVSQNMRTAMDGEIEKVCLVLMNKAGDVSSAFIREDATEALEKIVKSASAGRVLQGIIVAGAKSKNNTVRASCARFVNSLVERQGSAAILNSPDILSKLLPQLVTFSKDQTPPVRQSGRQSLVYLSEDPHFDQLMRKNAASHDYKAVKEILGNIDKKGGLDALDSTSVSLSSSLSRNGSVRKIQRKLPDALQLDLDEIRADLTASGWERRIGGLKRFDEMCAHAPRAVATDTLLIEAFIGRLNDINGKVALQGMDTYLMTLPIMNKLYSSEANLKAVLNQLVLALMSHLSSKSEEHRDLAQQALSDTVKMIEPVCLMPAVSAALRKANSKQKPFMLHIFTKMIAKAYNSKPKQVELTALPILWENMRNGLADPAIKKVVTDLAQVLGRNMGERNLMDQATAALDPQRKKILEAMLW